MAAKKDIVRELLDRHGRTYEDEVLAVSRS
jgi:hypothetical protein